MCWIRCHQIFMAVIEMIEDLRIWLNVQYWLRLRRVNKIKSSSLNKQANTLITTLSTNKFYNLLIMEISWNHKENKMFQPMCFCFYFHFCDGGIVGLILLWILFNNQSFCTHPAILQQERRGETLLKRDSATVWLVLVIVLYQTDTQGPCVLCISAFSYVIKFCKLLINYFLCCFYVAKYASRLTRIAWWVKILAILLS